MCGVPVHAADDYLQKLIGSGHRVAVCEQIEDPAEARKRGVEIGRAARRDAARHARHHHRGQAARSGAGQFPDGACARARRAKGATNWPSPGSTFRPARSASARPRRNGWPPILRASTRARSSCPTRCWRSRSYKAAFSQMRAALSPQPAQRLRQRRGDRRGWKRYFRRRDAGRLRRLSRGPSVRPPARCWPMSRRRRSASGRPFRAPGARAPRNPCSSTGDAGQSRDSSARFRASATAACVKAIDRTVTGAGARLLARADHEPADRCRRHPRAAGFDRMVPRRAGLLRRDPRRCCERAARHGARAVAAVARPRRAARPRRDRARA